MKTSYENKTSEGFSFAINLKKKKIFSANNVFITKGIK